MNAEAIVSVSAAVVGLVQVVKWAGLPSRFGPFAVLLISAIGVWLWGWSAEMLSRASAFQFFYGWVAVLTSAAGVFGLIRATPEAITSFKK